MTKCNYLTPQIVFITFATQDIVRTSGENDNPVVAVESDDNFGYAFGAWYNK